MKNFILGFGFCFCLLGLFILFDKSYYYSIVQYLLTILYGMGLSFFLMGMLRDL
mgnify:CR=1 FL=1